jgi:hypothetical protein
VASSPSSRDVGCRRLSGNAGPNAGLFGLSHPGEARFRPAAVCGHPGRDASTPTAYRPAPTGQSSRPSPISRAHHLCLAQRRQFRESGQRQERSFRSSAPFPCSTSPSAPVSSTAPARPRSGDVPGAETLCQAPSLREPSDATAPPRLGHRPILGRKHGISNTGFHRATRVSGSVYARGVPLSSCQCHQASSPTAWVAPNAVISGDVAVGPGSRILYGGS